MVTEEVGQPRLSVGLKVLAVLEAVATGQPMGVTEVARRLKLPKSTVHRILEDLAAGGWVVPVDSRSAGHRRWSTTRRVVALGLSAAEGDGLMEMASHRLAALRDEVGETVHLVLHDGEGLFVALCMDSPQPVRTHVEIGAWSPLHATSSGIAFLATLPDNAVEDVLDKGLPRYTANTPVTREEVWNEVQRVRDRGFAVNPTGWWRPDVFAVAAAITDPDMAPVAAVTISAPASRFTEAKSADLGRRVRALADELTQGLRMQSGASERSLPSAETRV